MQLVDLISNGLGKSPTIHCVWGDRVWSSSTEIDCLSNQLAHRLISLGVRPNTLVGICAERSIELVVGLLGIVKAGGAYVPMDPDYPADRLRFMAEDSSAAVLLTQERLLKRLPKSSSNAEVICLDKDWESIAKESREAPAVAIDPDDLAYVIYTSGSTGLPKGAMNSHKAICNRLLWMQDTFKLTADDTVIQKTPFSFDVSVWEFFWPLMSGARLVMPKPGGHQDPSYLADVIREHEVTVLHFVPSMLQVFLEQPNLRDKCKSIRAVICSGEALSHELQERCFSSLDAELHNLYGPTEAAVDVTHWPCQRNSEETAVPIGWPIANTQIHILDKHLQPVPIGVEGELHIGGVQVGKGYWNRPELTAERFIDDPFSDRSDAKLYKTGDLARWRHDGAVEYRGRIDFQVKIRGLRIELGEIETALESIDDINQATVMVHEPQPGDQRLVAYYVAASSKPIDDDTLRTSLSKSLPDYMLPQHFVHMQSMPVTPNGKLDRNALAMPEAKSSSNVTNASGDPVEAYLHDIWTETLNLPTIDRNQRFFEIGGTSLAAARIVNRLQKELGEFIYVVSMFDAPTIAEYSKFLKRDYLTAIAAKTGLAPEQLSDLPAELSQLNNDAFDIFEKAIPLLKPSDRKPDQKNAQAIFVLAPPRSGTTLLRVMLAGHSQLFAASELQLLCFETLQDRKNSFRDKFSLWLEGTLRTMMEIYSCSAEQAEEIMAAMEGENLSTKECYARIQKLVEPRILVDKSPSYALDPHAMEKAEADFSEPLYIHLVRNPYGMITSFENYHIEQVLYLYDQPYRGRPLGELIWHVSHRNILNFLQNIPAGRQYFIQFEEMVSKPESVMQRLCSHFGLDFEDGLVTPYDGIESKMVDGLYSESIPMGDTRMLERGRIESGAADAWRDKVDEEFLSEPTRILARKLGYEDLQIHPKKKSITQGRSARLAGAKLRRKLRKNAGHGSKNDV